MNKNLANMLAEAMASMGSEDAQAVLNNSYDEPSKKLRESVRNELDHVDPLDPETIPNHLKGQTQKIMDITDFIGRTANCAGVGNIFEEYVRIHREETVNARTRLLHKAPLIEAYIFELGATPIDMKMLKCFREAAEKESVDDTKYEALNLYAALLHATFMKVAHR